jgi:CDGSH-type Zn-finger protein
MLVILTSRSKNQPFCDGSHKGSGMTPIKFKVEETKKYFLCGCKQSAALPFWYLLEIIDYSDGTHRKEKGIKKYNEFLIQKNTELKADLAKSKNGMMGTFVIAVIAISAHMFWLTRKH